MIVVIESSKSSRTRGISFHDKKRRKQKKKRKIHLLSRGPDSPLKLILLNVLLWKLVRIPRFCLSLLSLPPSSAESSHTFTGTVVEGTVEFTSSSSSGTLLLSLIVCSPNSSFVPSFLAQFFSLISISLNDLDFPSSCVSFPPPVFIYIFPFLRKRNASRHDDRSFSSFPFLPFFFLFFRKNYRTGTILNFSRSQCGTEIETLALSASITRS